MGWKDKDGKLVSSEAEYAFRLRNDVKLYADFAKEPGVETIATFDIASDKTSVKIGTETVINLTVGNAKNSAGIPISKVTNADGEWSVDDSAITIANGVMTIPASYTTDEIKKVVTATCKINNVSKSVKIKLYNTEYYEDFTDISTISDWGLTDSSTSSLTGIVDTATSTDFAGMTAAGNGKVAVIGNGSSGTGKKLSYSKSFGVSDKSLLKFGFDIEPHRIRNDGKSATATLQFVDSDGTAVFTITVDTAGGNSSFNGTAVNGFKIGTVVSVDTVLDFTNKTISYTLTDTSGKELASGSGELTATNFDRMYFDGDWQYGKFAIDNVYMDCE